MLLSDRTQVGFGLSLSCGGITISGPLCKFKNLRQHVDETYLNNANFNIWKRQINPNDRTARLVVMVMAELGNCRIFKSCPMPSADAQNHRTRFSSNLSQKYYVTRIFRHNSLSEEYFVTIFCHKNIQKLSHPPMLKTTGHDSLPICHRSTVSFFNYAFKKDSYMRVQQKIFNCHGL